MLFRMADGATETEQIKLSATIEEVPSRFKIHNFTCDVSDVSYTFRVIKMKDSVFIYIGESGRETFDELAVAFPSLQHAISTQIFGSSNSCESQELSQQFSMRLKKQVFVSYNVLQNNSLKPLLIKRLADEIKQNADAF